LSVEKNEDQLLRSSKSPDTQTKGREESKLTVRHL